MKKLSLILLFLTAFVALKAQEAPFYKDIQNFKRQDSIKFPPKNAVLFIGSSTFTKWTDVQNYFPGHTIINRGFGGSSLPNLIYYIKDIVYPYQPKQVVIYCGENDFAGGASAQVVVERVQQLFNLIRERYPKVQITFISIKPSPSREKYLPLIIDANKMISALVSKMKFTNYINTYDAMFNADGKIMPDIFLGDNLHMNAKGYVIWAKIIEPYLK
ncbi:MAG: GDSL-type esterase/lipase family protein [Candidatus Pedobacter colombiensis]|uniref:GDSL-type esterase/lipase family protein n=1 Tax=Candidatus Pedobacter colombiensis TaxID=3121371 RepID=A0AAJ6B656_9SPHI|nr:GDSL-type esterase/lipase family protein [Pedobacter sp.]WEK19532.1 MAG: GDSL-type esterase/lipase family protein [Pedobacter sp.]